MKRCNGFQLMVACLAAAWLAGVPGAIAEENEEYTGRLSLVIRGVDVTGDDGLFREHQWMNSDTVGGIDVFTYRRGDLLIEGRSLFGEDDFGISLSFEPPEGLFFHGGADHYRKYFDDTGGYFEGASFSLDEELSVDIGNIWAEAGTASENTEVSFGYERQFKEGTKSLLEWNRPGAHAIYPATKELDQTTDIFKVDISHDINGLVLGDAFRYEIFDSDTSRSDLVPADLYDPEKANAQGHPVDTDDYEHDQFSNAFTVEKWIRDRFLLTAGYLYVNHKGVADFSMNYTPQNDLGDPPEFSSHSKHYSTEGYEFDSHSNVFTVGAIVLPSEDVTLSFGFQAEDSKTTSDDEIDRAGHGHPDTPVPVQAQTELDLRILREDVEVRFTGLSHSSIYASAKFVQEDNYHFEDLDIHGDPDHAGDGMLRETEEENRTKKFRIGFTTSPNPGFSLNVYYQRTNRDLDYNHLQDIEYDDDDGVLVPIPDADGYSAYIDSLRIKDDQVAAKLAFRPAPWLRAGVKYQFVQTDRDSITMASPGDEFARSHYDSGIFSLSAVVAPSPEFFLSATYSQQDTTTELRQIFAPGAVDDYRGDVRTFLTNARFTPMEKTDLTVRYLYSRADNEQDSGLPASSDFERHFFNVGLNQRIGKGFSGTAGYSYYKYEDFNYADAYDYKTHVVFGGIVKEF
ncbi:hypothetical protein ACFLU6_05860 [Acidobacteriota bacterium]